MHRYTSPALILLSLIALRLPAQTPVIDIPLTSQAVTVDGVLDEAAWGDAFNPTDSFTFRTGGSGPNYKTGVKVMWDANNLYVGVTAKDSFITLKDSACEPCPAGWRGGDDIFELHMCPDTALDSGAVSVFVYEVDLKGCHNSQVRRSKTTGSMMSVGGVNINCWNEQIEYAGAYHGAPNSNTGADTGWTMEMRVPFASFQPYPAGNVPVPSRWNPAAPPMAGAQWRMNFTRVDNKTLNESATETNTRYYHAGLGSSNHDYRNFVYARYKDTSSAVEKKSPALPNRTAEVTPNPFTGTARMQWNFRGGESVQLSLYNIQGQKLWTRAFAGMSGSAVWPAEPALRHPGLYLVRWSVDNKTIHSSRIFRE
jgi:hypothetical protein